MGKPRIFVSYSARLTPGGQSVDKDRAQALVEELRADGFDPWWDKDGLELSAAWNATISDQLANCHGAIVLLSPVSVQSDFVLHEAGYLSIRRRTEPDFPLCSFLCDGLDYSGLGDFLKAIQFSEFQYKPWSMDDRRAALNKALEPARANAQIPKTSIAALESTLAGHKYFGDIEVPLLRGCAQRLGWNAESHWEPDDAVPRLFVRHLFSLPMRKQLAALRELGGGLSVEQRKESFDWLVPFWIDEQAAARFSQVTTTPGHRGIVINAKYGDFTPEMFARRARPHLRWDPKTFSIQQHAPVGRDGGVVQQVRSSILSRLDLDENASKAEIRDALEYEAEDKTLCSVIIDADNDTLQDVAGLQADFREVLLVLLTDDKPVSIPESLQDQFETIVPPIGAGDDPRYDEERALRDFNNCMKKLDRPQRGQTSDEQ